MKDNYIKQGKNFISSKRASEISDYASDYIGQLCRAQKLDCERVGHVWFVTEESLRAHMTRVWSADSLRSRANNLKKRFIKGQSAAISPSVLSDTRSRITSKQAALLSGYAPDYIGQLCRGGKIEGTLVGKTWMIVEESLNAHIEKLKAEQIRAAEEKRNAEEAKRLEIEWRKINEAQSNLSQPKVVGLEGTDIFLLKNSSCSRQSRSQVPPVHNFSLHPPISSSDVLSVGLPDRSVQSSTMTSERRIPSIQILAARSVLTLATLAVLVIGGSLALVKIAGVNNTAVRQPFVASVYNTAFSINDLVTGKGMAVAPKTGVQADDVAMEGAIRDSFSDQVNISADESGTAGVITPVFKKTNGKDFMYVMVPVKEKVNDTMTQ